MKTVFMTLIHKLQNALMLAMAYTYVLVRGTATRAPQKLDTILVIHAEKLGDMICATPVFYALRLQYPQARIVVMANSLMRDLLEGNHDISECLESERGYFRLVRTVRALKPDAGFALVPSSYALSALFLGGAKMIVAPSVTGGFCPWQTKTYRLLLRLVRSVPHRMGHYVPGEYLRMLEPVGIHTSDTKKRLQYSNKALENVSMFLRAHQLIKGEFAVISPSAGNKIKNWPADRFARVAEHLVSRGLPVVVIGSPHDVEEVQMMMGAIEKPKGVIDACSKFSIDELKALIAQAALLVAVDTGPVYIAEAFGVPTVDIVGPVDEREQPPIGEKHRVVLAKREAPQLHIMNARMYDEKEARRQIEAIIVDMVNQSIDSLV